MDSMAFAERGPITRWDAITIAAGIAALALLYPFSVQAFHAAAHLAFIIGAVAMIEMGRHLRWFVRDDYPLFLAVSISSVAAIELVHAAAYPGFGLFGDSSAVLSEVLMLGGGLILAASMLVAPFLAGRRIRVAPIAAGYVIVTGLVLVAGFFVPASLLLAESGDPTPLVFALDLVISCALLLAVALTHRRRRFLRPALARAVEVALLLAALGWLLRPILTSDNFNNLMGVLFIAFLYIAVAKNGLAEPSTLMVRELQDQGGRSEALIEKLAFTDSLTGLANRSLLRDRLRRALHVADRSATSLAILNVDLDRFTDTNHLLGHGGADKMLQEVGMRIGALVWEADTVARWGGDEFTVLLLDVQGPADASRTAEQISQVLAVPWQVDGRQVSITASIGIALFPNDGGDAEVLLEHATMAQGRAKAEGGDGYRFYDAEAGRQTIERVRLEGELRRALERQEFVLHYQPQIDLEQGALVGVEALVRWLHPERGLVPPLEFLPVAESTGLIEELTAWVVAEACRQAAAWQAAGHRPVRVAVNLSARDFRGGRVCDVVDAALADSGLAPEWLEVELTETAIVEDTDATARQLATLRQRGVAVALDDFGTGYSSLSHLRTLPISRVKIDRSFVSRSAGDARSAAIVGAMIDLIHGLGLEVIAEGIETEEDVAFLRGHGCDLGQGYLFSRPLPAEECAALFGPAAPIEARDPASAQAEKLPDAARQYVGARQQASVTVSIGID